MGLQNRSNGGKIQRYRSSSVQEYRCFESWNLDKRKTTKTPYTSMPMLQTPSSCSEPSFCKSAQYSRSSFEMVWTIRLKKRRKRQEKQKESVTFSVSTSVKSYEVKLLVSSPRLVCGNSLWENIQDFESLSVTIRFTRVCELVSFRHRVSAGMNYKTRPDEDDGFGQIIQGCREYTLFRVNPLSRAFSAIAGGTIIGTIIGSVIEVQIVIILDQYGLEIAIPSPNGKQWTSDVMISRGKSRFVDEVRIPNAELRSSAELLTELQKAEGGESCLSCKGRRFQWITSRWAGSLNRQNQPMTLKPVPTSGRLKVTSSIVIAMNLEFNSMCLRKKHSLFTWSTGT